MSYLYEPSHPSNFPQNEAYPARSNHAMSRPVEYSAKPQMRPQQMPYSQPQSEMDYHRSGNPVMNPPSSTSSNSIFPRSASEALFDTASKFRQLPCRTFISVGTCPYRERCVYLHDPRCICKEAKTKTRRKNKEDVVLDALFWPVMPYPMVAAKLDMNRQPHVIQSYSVPLPQPDQYRKHDMAVYSMWMHFVDFCLANSETMNVRHADSAPCFSAPDVPINSYTEEARLKFFQFLSACNGRAVSRDEILRSTGAPLSAAAAQRHFSAAAVHARRSLVAAEESASGAGAGGNPYFTSSEAPLQEVLEPNMRPFRAPEHQQLQMHHQSQGQGQPHTQGHAQMHPHAQSHAQQVQSYEGLYKQAPAPANSFAAGLKVNTSINSNTTAGPGAYDPRVSRGSSQSTSPVTVAASPHRVYNNLGAQSRVAIGGALGALGAIGSGSGSSHSTPTHSGVQSREAHKEVPTSLSVLMNTTTTTNNTKMSMLSAQSDPWLCDSFGLTDSEERDSGSSYNSMPKDFTSLWTDDCGGVSGSGGGSGGVGSSAHDDHSAALSMNMLHDLM